MFSNLIKSVQNYDSLKSLIIILLCKGSMYIIMLWNIYCIIPNNDDNPGKLIYLQNTANIFILLNYYFKVEKCLELNA